jgi:PadR family transcriptional regulator PadR
MKELRRHGYLVSPGVVYPTLSSLERHGYLKRENRSLHGRVRKYYALTDRGSRMLSDARRKIRELVGEVMR